MYVWLMNRYTDRFVDKTKMASAESTMGGTVSPVSALASPVVNDCLKRMCRIIAGTGLRAREGVIECE